MRVNAEVSKERRRGRRGDETRRADRSEKEMLQKGRANLRRRRRRMRRSRRGAAVNHDSRRERPRE
jgi:hypothetical protein